MKKTIVKNNSKEYVAKQIMFLAIDTLVHKELGEPLVYNESQKWIFAFSNKNELMGFICHNDTNILYAYVIPVFRKMGVFADLYSELPIQKWNVVANNNSLEFFKKRGFKVTKEFVKYYKMSNK